jgi:hypothetical protein
VKKYMSYELDVFSNSVQVNATGIKFRFETKSIDLMIPSHATNEKQNNFFKRSNTTLDAA